MVWKTAEALVQDFSVELLPQRETMITKPASRLSRLNSQYFPDVAFPRQQMAFAGEHKGRSQYTHAQYLEEQTSPVPYFSLALT